MTIVCNAIPNEIVNDISASALVELNEGSSRDADSLTGLTPSTADDSAPAAVSALAPAAISVLAPRPTDDQINRFLLCVLASKSAKKIKEKAQDAGERLLITTIVKRVLTSYRQAEEESPGLLSGPGLHLESLHRLNMKVLNEQINGSVQHRVRDSEVRFERATRQGDEGRIKIEKETLARDIADRERIAGEFR